MAPVSAAEAGAAQAGTATMTRSVIPRNATRQSGAPKANPDPEGRAGGVQSTTGLDTS